MTTRDPNTLSRCAYCRGNGRVEIADMASLTMLTTTNCRDCLATGKVCTLCRRAERECICDQAQLEVRE